MDITKEELNDIIYFTNETRVCLDDWEIDEEQARAYLQHLYKKLIPTYASQEKVL